MKGDSGEGGGQICHKSLQSNFVGETARSLACRQLQVLKTLLNVQVLHQQSCRLHPVSISLISIFSCLHRSSLALRPSTSGLVAV